MFQAIDLRHLTDIQAGERAVVSAYLTKDRGLEALSKRRQHLEAMLEDQPDELEHFRQSFVMIEKLVGEHGVTDEGLAVFACWADDFIEGYPLSVAVRPQLRIGATPYVRPIAELQDEYESFLIVAADNEAARIIHVTCDEAVDEDRVRGDVKQHVKKGGWSQQRYSRRRDNQLRDYAKDVVSKLEDLVREEGYDRIVLLGSDESLNEIEDEMPDAVAEKVVGRNEINLNEGEERIWDAAYKLYWEEERASERRLWDRIREACYADGPCAAGPDEVLQALLVGRASDVILTRDAKLQGRQCRDCDTPAADAPDSCPTCGSARLFPIDLTNTITAQAEQTSAAVDYVQDLPGLTKLGHVAALLRY